MPVVAAIDIGTNSTRLLVAKVDVRKKPEVMYPELKITRLGENIGHKILLPGAMERTLAAIVSFLARARAYGATNIILAATSAVRDAANREEFLSLVEKETGYRIKVLPGAEEARLSYLGVVSGLDLDPRQVTVMDVGGGSTEFTWPIGDRVVYKSFNIGAVRMTESGDSYAAIKEFMAGCLKSLPVAAAKPQALVGVGGTVTTLGAVNLQLAVYDSQLVHGSTLSLARVAETRHMLEQKSLAERKKIAGLQPERADIIVAGVRIVQSVMELLNKEHLVISEADILHGLVLAAANSVEINFQ